MGRMNGGRLDSSGDGFGMAENRLLVVDDDPRISRLAIRVAKKLGYETEAIGGSSDFERRYATFKPDVILLDLNMPGMDGIELLRFLADRNSRAAILLISGVGGRVLNTTTRLGSELGLNMVGGLPKPVDIDVLRDALARQFKDTRKITEADLAGAIDNDELFVCYQPKIDLRSQRVCGAEALVRWRSPVHGQVSPDEFLPLAEAGALIEPLTYKVLERSIRDHALWDEAVPDLALAVNLSPRLLTDLTLPDRVEAMLRAHDFDPTRLTFEVTETGAMEDPTRSMEILARLCVKGMHLSIDDFGTGASSFVQLYRLPYGEIKIDKSFVMDAMTSDEAAAIVRSVVGLGRNMGLQVVAEGIEDQETFDWLRQLGCDFGQGYHISRPLEASQFVAWLRQRT